MQEMGSHFIDIVNELHYLWNGFWLMLCVAWTRFWNYGPKEISGVIVEIQNLGSFTANF